MEKEQSGSMHGNNYDWQWVQYLTHRTV
jgi:hypothetical protein